VDALVFLKVSSLGRRLFTAISLWCLVTCLTTNLAGRDLEAVAKRRADPAYTKYLYWVPPVNATESKKKKGSNTKAVPTPEFYVEDVDLPQPPPGLKWWKYADGIPIPPDPATELGPEYARYGWRYDAASAETSFVLQDIDKATMANVGDRSKTLWVHALTAAAVTAYTLWTLAAFSRDAVRLRLRYLSTAQPGADTHTVLVTDVPGVRGGTAGDALDRTLLRVLPTGARTAVRKGADAGAGALKGALSPRSKAAANEAGPFQPPGPPPAAGGGVETDPWAKAARRLGDGATATQMVAAEFEELYPGEVADVQAVYNTAGPLDGALAEYERVKAGVTHLLDVYTAKARRAGGRAADLAKIKRKEVKAVNLVGRPVYGAWGAETYGKDKAARLDAVDLGLARMAHLAGVIKEGQAAAVADPNPAAFVTFKTRRSQVLATEVQQHHDTSAWATQAAPEPRSVIWPALRQRAWEQRIRFWVTWVAFFALCLLFMIPVGKVQSLLTPGSLSRVPGMATVLNAPFLSGIIVGILPSLALIIFIALMPPIIRLMCRFQGMRTEGDLDRGVVTKFFIFQVFIVFFGTFVAGSFFDKAKVWAQDPMQGLKAIGTGAPSASTFFLSYIAIKALFAPAFKHLRIIPFVIYGIKTSLASTERAKARTWSEQVFKYGVDIPQMTMVILLGLVFCAINPILPPVCLLYFLIVGFFNKYRVLYVARPTYQTGGQMWLAVFNHGERWMGREREREKWRGTEERRSRGAQQGAHLLSLCQHTRASHTLSLPSLSPQSRHRPGADADRHGGLPVRQEGGRARGGRPPPHPAHPHRSRGLPGRLPPPARVHEPAGGGGHGRGRLGLDRRKRR